nr:hypothetical protein [Tanacetum cinerariifolium]
MDACNDENWINAMNLEMEALHRNNTWVLADLPVGNLGLCGSPLYKKCTEKTRKPQLEAHGNHEEKSGFTWEVVTLGWMWDATWISDGISYVVNKKSQVKEFLYQLKGAYYDTIDEALDMYMKYDEMAGFEIKKEGQRLTKSGAVQHKYIYCNKEGVPKDIKSYMWLLIAFMTAFPHEPIMIVTDQDGAMKKAIEAIFKKAKHRLCMWHIMQKNSIKESHEIHSDSHEIQSESHEIRQDL